MPPLLDSQCAAYGEERGVFFRLKLCVSVHSTSYHTGVVVVLVVNLHRHFTVVHVVAMLTPVVLFAAVSQAIRNGALAKLDEDAANEACSWGQPSP